ncbi:MAG: YaaA family protein [Acidimicrobiia bacterium]
MSSAKIAAVPRSVPFALLLPPSEGKAEGGAGPPWSPAAGRFGEALGPLRATIVEALAAVDGGSQRLLGVGGRHLERARAANVSLLGAPTLPAGRRYTGVVWDHLDLAGLPGAARRRASASIVVLSGLLGAVGVDDPVPGYRLKIGASLPPLGVLARWWRPALSDVLDEFLTRRVVVDLLPNDHASAWVPRSDRYRAHVKVAFVERSGKVAGQDAKAAKGLLARHIVLEGGDPRASIETFAHDRFEVRAGES